MTRADIMRLSRPAGRATPAFTLVELLVSVAVIMVLVATLFPVVRSTRERASAAICMDHERRLWQGFVLFAADHDDRLPGGLLDFWPAGRNDQNPEHWDWLSGAVPQWGDTWSVAPQKGTVFRYVRDLGVYRCPSMEVIPPPAYAEGSGWGSNGRFDYAAFMTFEGCRLYRVPLTAIFVDPKDGSQTVLPTPIICEEATYTLNGNYDHGDIGPMSGDHDWFKQMGHQHRGGSHYVSPDGAVHWFAEPAGANAFYWSVVTTRGKVYSMGGTIYWGFFESQ